MIPQNFDYATPATLDEALALLADGSSKALAGGQSLIPLMKLRFAAPEKLVDLSRIPGLNEIREESDGLHIGATATHYQIESSALLRERCPLLAETAAHIGDVQVRNLGTLGGSLAHADPAADYPAALFALDAQVRIAGPSNERTLSIDDFLIDMFTTVLEPGELIREVIVPAEAPGTGTAYQKVLQPASGFAVVGIAVRIRRAEGRIAMARIGVTGLTSRAFRAADAEALLEGTEGSAEDIRRAAAVVADDVDATSDLHASADYRCHLARVHTARALTIALGRSA